jgi:hypothetical protein
MGKSGAFRPSSPRAGWWPAPGACRTTSPVVEVAHLVSLELRASNGLPGPTITGLPDAVVRESQILPTGCTEGLSTRHVTRRAISL